MNLFKNQKQTTDIENKLMETKADSRGEINEEFGMNLYILLYIRTIYKRQITYKDLLIAQGTIL